MLWEDWIKKHFPYNEGIPHSGIGHGLYPAEDREIREYNCIARPKTGGSYDPHRVFGLIPSGYSVRGIATVRLIVALGEKRRANELHVLPDRIIKQIAEVEEKIVELEYEKLALINSASEPPAPDKAPPRFILVR